MMRETEITLPAGEVTRAPEHAVSMPTFVDHAHLVVSDLPMVSAWYQRILGLAPIETSASGTTLGAGGKPLLSLTTQSGARIASQRGPGLFHNAFLMPDRTELGRWLAHAAHSGVALQGASDHLVSEAIYLADPEGNGIEVYRDRPRSEWRFDADGAVGMATLPLDLQALYDEAPKTGFDKAPDATVLGHIHLQVSALPEADAFFPRGAGAGPDGALSRCAFLRFGQIPSPCRRQYLEFARRGEARGAGDGARRLHDPVQRPRPLRCGTRRPRSSGNAGDPQRRPRPPHRPWGIGVTLAA